MISDPIARIVVELSLQRTTLLQKAAMEGRELPSVLVAEITCEMVRCHNILLGKATEEDAEWLLRKRMLRWEPK